MTCGSRSLQVTKPVFSGGNTASGKVFVAFHRVAVQDWVRARVSILRQASTSGVLQTDTAARYANVESDLPDVTAVPMPTTALSLTGNGQEFGQEFSTLNDGYQIIEFGVEAWNTTGTDHEMAQITLTIDLQQ